MRVLSLIVLALAVASMAFAAPSYTVTRVIDGDTVVLNGRQTVRLIGVDTPETYPSMKLKKDAARSKRDIETIRALGKRASEFTKRLVLGKRVRLEFDQVRRGRYGRTLGYLFLRNGTFVNEQIIRQGYGAAYTKYPFKYMDHFRAAEREAREAQRGLWAEGGLP